MLILVSTVTGGISISAFASLVCVPVGNTNSTIGIKSCAMTAGIKKFKSIIKKKKKKHDKIVLLGKDKLIDSYISHCEFISIPEILCPLYCYYKW